MWEGEEELPEKPDKTPKQRLLQWIQSKVPDKPINNFTNDWNDGTAIGALVDACAPGKNNMIKNKEICFLMFQEIFRLVQVQKV